MADARLRRHIAREAAKLMYDRVETEYFTAKRKAAARLGINFKHQPQYLPANREIREEIQALAQLYEGERRCDDLRDMRVAALRMMRLLNAFEPRLIGSVATGHVRKGSDIDLHVFSDSVTPICEVLEQQGLPHTVQRKRVIKHHEERIFTHIHLQDRFDFELTVYERSKRTYRFRSSITGKAIERFSMTELEDLIRREHPGTEIPVAGEEPVDRFLIWSALLAAMERVKQNPRWHPEGDAQYHALQAFELARDEVPYDQELITAALLHDVGKAIDPQDHVEAGLEALEGTLTDRETFLIVHHMDALAYLEGRLPRKRRQTLEANEWFPDLLTLRGIDTRARRRGVAVCTVEEAINHLRSMEMAE